MSDTSRRWFICGHAIDRMREMGVKRDEVVSALAEGTLDYPGRPAKTGAERRVAVGGRLAVVYSAAGDTVVTVLWAGREGRGDPAAA